MAPKIFHTILDTILPPRCIVSGAFVDHQGMIDGSVWRDLNFIEAPFCQRCGNPFDFAGGQGGGDKMVCTTCTKNPPAYSIARSALFYDDVSRDMILGFKHGDQTHYVTAFMPWLKRAAQDILPQADYLIPVPLHRWRLLKRRYNQAAIMAQYFGKEVSLPVLLNGLERAKSTATQGHLSHQDRKVNVRNAFQVPETVKPQLRHKKVILIDDVFTTGATVAECTKTLLKAGVSDVRVLTLAKVVKKGY